MPERLSPPEQRPSQAPQPERRATPERFDVARAPEKPAEPAANGEQWSEPVSSPVTRSSIAPQPRDPVLQEVESILSDGLDEAYAGMDPVTQREFKEEGETAAVEIASLLKGAKVQIRKIIQVITRWLKIIPGVSHLFLEQEAKIKTDRLLGLRRDNDV